MQGEEVDITIAFAGLSVSVRRVLVPSPASSTAPERVEVDAETWATREACARQAGRAALSRLTGKGRPLEELIPRTRKAPTVYVVLRRAGGEEPTSAEVYFLWRDTLRQLQGVNGRICDLAIWASFASQREAKQYVEAAERRWPTIARKL